MVSGWDGQSWQPTSSWIAPLIGLLDDPEERAQRPLRIDLGGAGHLAIYGAPGSGKTTLLQTMITALVQDHSPDDVNLYILDFGGRMLRVFANLPHVGAVITPDEPERVIRLMNMLAREMEQRKDLFARAGISTLAAYHGQIAGAPPAMVVLLDNYIDFANSYPEQADALARISREGGNFGIHLVVTSNTINSLPTRLTSNIGLAVALELTDPGEYPIVVGRTNGLIPERGVRGRGLVRDTPPLEFQTALPSAGQSDSVRSAGLRSLITLMTNAWTGTRAREVRTLPDNIALATLVTPTATWPTPATDLSIPLGLDVDTMDPFIIDLAAGPHFLIAGPPASGKTWLLQTWLLALAEQFSPSCVQFYLSGLTGPQFQPFCQLPHVATYIEVDSQLAEVVDDLRVQIEQRRQERDRARREAGGLLDESTFLVRYPALILVIDDYDQFRDVTDENTRMALEALLKRGRGLGIHVLLADVSSDMATLSYSDTLGKAVKDGQTGILLGTTDINDLSIFNLRLPPEEQGKTLVPGRGFFARRNRARGLHIANAQHSPSSMKEWMTRITGKI
jgi:S-DNA-T family DNA segregation ATPase FtsK/SpoIIIE